MSEPRNIVSYNLREYGHMRIKLDELLKNRGITRNRLHTLIGVKYEVIDRYFKAEKVAWVDLDFLSKVCYSLNCRIEDILEYEPPESD